MKTAIALRHLYFEDFGTLDAVLGEYGYHLHYMDPALGKMDETALQQADLLIILAAPLGLMTSRYTPFLNANCPLYANACTAQSRYWEYAWGRN